MIKNADVHIIVLSSSLLLTHLYHRDSRTSHFHVSVEIKRYAKGYGNFKL